MLICTIVRLLYPQDPPRKERDTSGVFETSRWTPVVMDIMEAVVHEKNLDTSHYPFFHAESQVCDQPTDAHKSQLFTVHSCSQMTIVLIKA